MSDQSRTVKDPICGKDVDTLRARAVGIFGGVTYYFCSAECKVRFVDPRKEPRRARDTAEAGDAKDASKAARAVIELEAASQPPLRKLETTDKVNAIDLPPSNARRYIVSAVVIMVIVAGVVWITMMNR